MYTFWKEKRVLITGNTGFKGSWLTIWLQKLGASVTGLSLPPVTSPNLFKLARVDTLCENNFIDIRDSQAVSKCIRGVDPEIVFHMAAQPLVRASYGKPLETFSTNVMGTAHVLEALRKTTSVRVAVVVTSDKIYRNNEWHYPYRENDALGGHDPYSASKAASEIIIASYRDAFLSSNGVSVASARAGNVIGGGDWSEDRLCPDIVRAYYMGKVLEVRSPDAIRPWQHVLEPLFGYLALAEMLWNDPTLAGSYNFGPQTHEAAKVRRIVELSHNVLEGGKVRFGTGDGPHEAEWLALEVAKARVKLGVEPRWTLNEAIQRTMTWYRNQHTGLNARELCLAEIEEYEAGK